MPTIRQKMTAGAAWMVLIKLLERGLGVISTLILARLLIPEDFGIVAMAMSVIALLELIGAFGFDVALIRQPDAKREHYDTAWTFNALIGVVVAVGLIVLSKPVAGFYHEPRIIPVIVILAAGSLIQGFENIGVVAFRKELDFRREFLFIGGKKLAMFATTIPLAFLLRNYWALVIGTIIGRVAGVVLSFLVHSFRPKFSFAKREDLFSFSKWVFVVNLLFFVRERATDFVLGRMVGPSVLGLYTVGYEISNLPTTELVAPINRAVFPGYAKMSHDLRILREEYIGVIGLISILAIPAAVGISALAELLVPVLLGNKWLGTIPVIQILAFYGLTQAVQSNSYSVFLAIGKPFWPARINAIFVAVLLPSMITLTYRYQLMGAVWALLGTALVIMPINLGIAFRQLGLSAIQFFAVVYRPIFASIPMYFVVRELLARTMMNVTGIASLGLLLGSVATGAAIYVVSIYGLWKMTGRPLGPEHTIITQVRNRLQA